MGTQTAAYSVSPPWPLYFPHETPLRNGFGSTLSVQLKPCSVYIAVTHFDSKHALLLR